MNKIILVDDEIESSELDDCLFVKMSSKDTLLGVKVLKIKITKDTDLEINYSTSSKVKFDIYINVDAGVCANVFENKLSGEYKLGYRYYLAEGSCVNVYKINDVKEIKESIIFNLNGKGAKVNYLLKTISSDEEKYDIMVYHNAMESVSNIVNNGVNVLDGTLKFNVSGFVPKNVKGCFLNQNNRIINLTKRKCEVKPNLFIDENDVVANHSAHIGKCDSDSMFYLMSRGINEDDSRNLIINGFLMNGLINNENMLKIIDKYWR